MIHRKNLPVQFVPSSYKDITFGELTIILSAILRQYYVLANAEWTVYHALSYNILDTIERILI